MTAPLRFFITRQAIEEAGRGRRARVDETQITRELVPGKVVPGHLVWVVRFELNVHAEARFAGHLLDDEVIAPIVRRLLRIIRPLRVLRFHVEAKEANVRFDFGAEHREQNFRVHVRFRFHFHNHRVLRRIGRAVFVAKDVGSLRVNDRVRIFLQQLAAHEQDELTARRTRGMAMRAEL